MLFAEQGSSSGVAAPTPILHRCQATSNHLSPEHDVLTWLVPGRKTNSSTSVNSPESELRLSKTGLESIPTAPSLSITVDVDLFGVVPGISMLLHYRPFSIWPCYPPLTSLSYLLSSSDLEILDLAASGCPDQRTGSLGYGLRLARTSCKSGMA